MTDYLTSDVHLTFDAVERSGRFARFVGALGPGDRLTIVGDLCDFWLASRERHRDPRGNAGLGSLMDFRGRGGSLVILVGNHDGQLGRVYRDWFGEEVVGEPHLMRSHGVRLCLMHGHRAGARKPWKAAMEGRAFLHAFGLLPGPVARILRAALDRKNLGDLTATHLRHLSRYREAAAEWAGTADVFVFGHVHERFDERVGGARMLVIGDWFKGSPVVRVDGSGVWVGDAGEAGD